MFYGILTPLLLTLISEVPLTMFLFRRNDIAFFLFAFGLNLVTNLSLNLILLNRPPAFPYLWGVLIGETMVFMSEFFAYGLISKRWALSALTSFLSNSLSLVLGLAMNLTLQSGADIRIYAIVFLSLLVTGLAFYFVFSFSQAKREGR